MNLLFGLLLSFVFFVMMLLLSELCEPLGREVARKTLHILVCNWWIIAMVFFRTPFTAAIIPAGLVFANWISCRFHLVDVMEREGCDGEYGPVYYAVSMLILALMTFQRGADPVIGGVGLFVLGYGDGVASLVGKKVPLVKYKVISRSKSLGGSLAMFLASFASVYLLLAATGWSEALSAALVAAGVGTVLEAVTPYGLDNLSVPLACSGVYALLFF